MIKLIQVSDFHVSKDKDYVYNDEKPYYNLRDTYQLILKNEPRFDLLLLSGDLTNDESIESYKLIDELTDEFKVPKFYVAGNHDNYEKLKEAFNEKLVAPKSFAMNKWKFILLHSVLEGEVAGQVSDHSLEFLERELESVKDLGFNIFICLHHHLINVDGHMDRYITKNPQAFFDIVDKYDNIKLVTFGHIHQIYEGKRNNVSYLSAPATAYQIKPGTEGFEKDQLGSGYRWFNLDDDGTFTTGVNRV